MTHPAVVFDLDGTLIDGLPEIAEAVNILLEREGVAPLLHETIKGYVGHGAPYLLDRVIAATPLNPAEADRLMRDYMPIYAAASENARLIDGVEQALTTLAGCGVQMGLCTNKPAAATQAVIRATGLDRWLGVVVTGDSLPLRKPDPAPLLHAFDALKAARSLYVGDSEVDAEAARRAGVSFALYTRGLRKAALEDIPHDAAFDSFEAFPAVVARLTG